jgi:hypothetical protein
LNAAILAVFVVERSLRIVAHGFRFFKDPWSLFDFAVVAIALVPANGSLAVLRTVLEAYPCAWVFFVVFILVTTFTMLNLFIAVIVNATQAEHDIENAILVESGTKKHALKFNHLRMRLRCLRNCSNRNSEWCLGDVEVFSIAGGYRW